MSNPFPACPTLDLFPLFRRRHECSGVISTLGRFRDLIITYNNSYFKYLTDVLRNVSGTDDGGGAALINYVRYD